METYISTLKIKGKRLGRVCLSLRERLHLRTRQLALTAGRSDGDITQPDYEQAKCEVTGEVDLKRQNTALETRKRDSKGHAPLFQSK